MKKLPILLAMLFFLPQLTQAADETWDELMEEFEEIIVYTAAKRSESVFQTRLSASVITREELINSGATSIAEALRLVPGLLVREQTAGNFDVHVRGFDNTPPHSLLVLAANSITLVMVDGRPVYNYFSGGTFWEALPIDLGDVERIEVVRGPAAALYGPNAAAGVINIITRRTAYEASRPFAANVQVGDHETIQGFAAFHHQFANNLNVMVTANSRTNERHESRYYDWVRDAYVADVDTLLSPLSGQPSAGNAADYTDPRLGLKRTGVNAFLTYPPFSFATVTISAGFQASEAQKVYVDNLYTPLTTDKSNTAYVDAKLKAKGLSVQTSLAGGSQSTSGFTEWDYDFSALDLVAEYEFKIKRLSLLPGVNYRRAEYDGPFLDGKQRLTTRAFMFNAEYKWDHLTVTAAIRTDDYEFPDTTYVSFQIAAGYQTDRDHVYRAVFSRSHRAPFILGEHLNYSTQPTPVTELRFLGSKSSRMMQIDMLEIGYRQRLTESWLVDMEGFFARANDYSDMVTESVEFTPTGVIQTNRYRNVEMTAHQFGCTGSLSYFPSGRAQFRAFATLQRSEINNYLADPARPDSLVDFKHEATPAFFGGFYMNYRPVSRLNLNLNSYFYSDQTFSHTFREADISAKFILSAKILLQLNENISLYVNGRNVLDNTTREFGFADRIESTLLIGADVFF